MAPSKKEIYATAKKIWNAEKVQSWEDAGVDIVIGKREGYCFWDLDGRRIINMHLNGGVYNLGHRNPEVQEALVKATELYDAGNHYFPSVVKNELAQSLLDISPDTMEYVTFNNSGGESIDAAIKFAKHVTRRPRVISVEGAYHGATGIAMEAGGEMIIDFFGMKTDPDEYTRVEYNNLEALEEALKHNDTACVIIESIPATYGFPIPDEGYLKGVEELAHRYGALYIADEVQTGLMRSGSMWCSVGYGATPDMIVTGKGLSGGFYPMSAVIMNPISSTWLKIGGSAHLSSFGSSELGCAVACKALEITQRESTAENVRILTNFFSEELARLQKKHSGFFKGTRQRGLIIGLETTHPEGSVELMKALYKNGVWAIRAAFDHSVLQFKPGLLMDKALAEEVIQIMDVSMGEAANRID
ncbi:Succinylornithine transaminase [compost metagenome]